MSGQAPMSRTIVVVPCFNEADRLDVEAFVSFGDSSVEFLFVDDGSTDDTAAVLKQLVEAGGGRFSVLALERNMGKAEAVRRGIREAITRQPDHVGFFDADLSTSLDEIPRFIELLDGRPQLLGVLGSRVRLLGRSIDRRPTRHYAGRIFATLVSFTLGLPVYDTQCGAKFFRTSPQIEAAFEEPFRSRWVFDVELLARVARIARTEGRAPEGVLVELPLLAWRDVPGSKLRLRHAVTAFFDLMRIRREYR